jgi:hypothetical protein
MLKYYHAKLHSSHDSHHRGDFIPMGMALSQMSLSRILSLIPLLAFIPSASLVASFTVKRPSATRGAAQHVILSAMPPQAVAVGSPDSATSRRSGRIRRYLSSIWKKNDAPSIPSTAQITEPICPALDVDLRTDESEPVFNFVGDLTIRSDPFDVPLQSQDEADKSVSEYMRSPLFLNLLLSGGGRNPITVANSIPDDLYNHWVTKQEKQSEKGCDFPDSFRSCLRLARTETKVQLPGAIGGLKIQSFSYNCVRLHESSGEDAVSPMYEITLVGEKSCFSTRLGRPPFFNQQHKNESDEIGLSSSHCENEYSLTNNSIVSRTRVIRALSDESAGLAACPPTFQFEVDVKIHMKVPLPSLMKKMMKISSSDANPPRGHCVLQIEKQGIESVKKVISKDVKDALAAVREGFIKRSGLQ